MVTGRLPKLDAPDTVSRALDQFLAQLNL